MIDKKKFRLYRKLIILVLCFMIVIRIFVLILAKYESISNSNANMDVAFYLLKEDYQTMTLNLSSLFPSDTPYIYTFSISNKEAEKTAEVNLQYDLEIKTTTNLPLEFKIYMNEDYRNTGAKNIIKTSEIKKDDDETYFNYITTDTQTLYFDNPVINQYQLIVYFPSVYNTINYQDLFESLEIKVNSKQIID